MSGAPALPAVPRHGSEFRGAAAPRLADPKYVRGANPSERWAHFPSGTVVRAHVGRLRAYPGLPSIAPSTLAFYREACRRFASAHCVLDAGAGSGIGTLELSGVFDRVIAVDCDPHAVAFAKSHAPLAHHVRADIERDPPSARVDAGVAVDVLGHVRSPVSALRTLRGWLDDDGEILIAEPTASVDQRLDRPARRAFSPCALESLLHAAGLAVRSWVYQGAQFMALVAAPRPSDAWLDLVRGDGAAEAGDFEAALDAYSRAEHSADAEVTAEAVFSTSLVLMATGRLELAASTLMRAGELLPTDARPRAALSRIMLASDAPEEALQLGTIAVRLDPTAPDAAVAVALAADALHHPDALGAWRIAHELAPDDPFVASELGRLACEHDDPAAGVHAFERVRDYGDPLPAAFHVILARMLLAVDRTADAELEARVAQKLDPKDRELADLVQEIRSRPRPRP